MVIGGQISKNKKKNKLRQLTGSRAKIANIFQKNVSKDLSEFLHPLCYYIHPCLFESIIYVL